MPDGTTFEFSDKKTEATTSKMTSVSESESLPITSAKNSISDTTLTANIQDGVRNSLKEHDGAKANISANIHLHIWNLTL